MDPQRDERVDGQIAVAEVAHRLDELRRHAMDLHLHELVDIGGSGALLLDVLDERAADVVHRRAPRVGVLQPGVAEARHAGEELGIGVEAEVAAAAAAADAAREIERSGVATEREVHRTVGRAIGQRGNVALRHADPVVVAVALELDVDPALVVVPGPRVAGVRAPGAFDVRGAGLRGGAVDQAGQRQGDEEMLHVRLDGRGVERVGRSAGLRGPPLQMRGPPLQMRGPPLRTSGPPLRTSGPPLRTSGPPLRTRGPPLRMTGPAATNDRLGATDERLVATKRSGVRASRGAGGTLCRGARLLLF